MGKAEDYTNVVDATAAEIHGDVYISKYEKVKNTVGGSFTTDGYLIMDRARIDGLLSLDGTQFTGDFNNGLELGYARVGGAFLWREIQKTSKTELLLDGANIGVLTVDDDKNSWPSKGNLSLDGCTYGEFGFRGIGSAGPDANNESGRREWLNRQKDPSLPQPYEMLVKVLVDEGDEGAVQIHIDEEDARLSTLGWGERVWQIMLRGTVAYGYKPLWAGGWILGFVGIGWVLFFAAIERI